MSEDKWDKWMERKISLVGVRSPWPLLTTTVVQIQQRAVQQYSSTAVQQYSTSRTAAQQRFHTTHAERWSADFY